jgi:hypothetical protein
MTKSASNRIVKKDLSDLGAGVVAAVGSTILLKLLSRRGRIIRTLALASIAGATTFARSRFFAPHKTTTYSWSREVDHSPSLGDRDV